MPKESNDGKKIFAGVIMVIVFGMFAMLSYKTSWRDDPYWQTFFETPGVW